MGRQVIRGEISRLRGDDLQVEVGGDTYSERLLKLIPGETVAVYIFIDGVLRSSLANLPEQLTWWLWSMFIAVGLGNLLYLKRLQNVKHSVQYIIHSIAYIIWIISIGGPFKTYTWYQPFMGSVLLALFTFIVPQHYKGLVQSKTNTA